MAGKKKAEPKLAEVDGVEQVAGWEPPERKKKAVAADKG